MKNEKLFNKVANHIAEDVLQFDNSCTVEEFLKEDFKYEVSSNGKWFISYNERILFEGFKSEEEVNKFYTELYNKVFEVVDSYL